MKKIRVLVVDDSAFMRKIIPQLLNSDPEIEVVGTAMDGIFALERIKTLTPDVITLDISMPRMDGIETLRHIMKEFRIPTIIISSLTTKDADLTFQALEIGAFDFITKPLNAISTHIHEISNELIQKVKTSFKNPSWSQKIKNVPPLIVKNKETATLSRKTADKVLAIGTSTGGPNALSYLLPQFPRDFPAGILIVQHMPEGFIGMFASRLNSMCEIDVKEAEDGDIVLSGRALIAQSNKHLKIKQQPLGTIAVMSSSPPVNGHRPSADILFKSVAAEYGANAVGLIMTGMGDDGAAGIGEIMKCQGLTIAQDKDSCVVFGMPKAAIDKKHIHHIVPLDKIKDFLLNIFNNNTVGTNTSAGGGQ
ncbi:MAG TPA: chemotaxis response regulator protein-glutamate methylesterase [bacterium]